ncbi:MAG: hypothetical protein HYV19_09900 [Gemmatimonadetes bacterium]|nr:hypothetical protein [Gemmatimonadota bacterium]
MLVACGREPSAIEDTTVVSLSASSSVIRLGDSTRITVSVVNAGTRAVVIDAGACPWWFEALKDGVVVAPGQMACPAIAMTASIEPGASYSHTFVWRGDRFDIRSPTERLGAGSYLLRPAVSVSGTMVRGTTVPFQISP